MLLTDYIAEKNILLDIKPADKADAVEQLARKLLRNRSQTIVSSTIQQLLTREAIESTGIGQGIAIPHARVPELKDLTCAVGRLGKELEFRSIDKKPVSLVFLICYPPARQTLYLNFVGTLARLLHEEAHVELLKTAESPSEAFEILQEFSNALAKPEMDQVAKPARGPVPKFGDGSSRALALLARLELCEEQLATTRTNKTELKRRIENISALLEPRILQHYRRLKSRPGYAVVTLEGGVCQGCLMKLPPQFVQNMRRQQDQIQLCSHCRRFLYQV